MRINWKTIVLGLIFYLMFGSACFGQDHTGGSSASSKTKKYVYEGNIVLVGKIAKPQVQFFISREKGTSDEALTFKENFVPKILKSVENPPF